MWPARRTGQAARPLADWTRVSLCASRRQPTSSATNGSGASLIQVFQYGPVSRCKVLRSPFPSPVQDTASGRNCQVYLIPCLHVPRPSMAPEWSVFDSSRVSWYNLQLGRWVSRRWAASSSNVVCCLEELPDSQSRSGAGQGRPTKQQVGAGRREPRPDYNRNRKHSRQRSLWSAGKGRTGGVRAHQRSWRHGRLGERATGSKASGPGQRQTDGRAGFGLVAAATMRPGHTRQVRSRHSECGVRQMTAALCPGSRLTESGV